MCLTVIKLISQQFKISKKQALFTWPLQNLYVDTGDFNLFLKIVTVLQMSLDHVFN